MPGSLPSHHHPLDRDSGSDWVQIQTPAAVGSSEPGLGWGEEHWSLVVVGGVAEGAGRR